MRGRVPRKRTNDDISRCRGHKMLQQYRSVRGTPFIFCRFGVLLNPCVRGFHWKPRRLQRARRKVATSSIYRLFCQRQTYFLCRTIVEPPPPSKSNSTFTKLIVSKSKRKVATTMRQNWIQYTYGYSTNHLNVSESLSVSCTLVFLHCDPTDATKENR